MTIICIFAVLVKYYYGDLIIVNLLVHLLTTNLIRNIFWKSMFRNMKITYVGGEIKQLRKNTNPVFLEYNGFSN